MLFELRQVRKQYGAVTALNDLSVQSPTGAIGLLGPNGAGKTTMIRTLLGLIQINRGEGHVLGHDIRSERMEIRQLTGFVPEDECLFPGVKGIEFVSYAGELSGMGRRDALQRAHEVLDYVRLGEARYRPADSYSTGMKQRLKLASAIVHDPRLLILDEPTNGMDPDGRAELLKLAYDLAHAKDMSLLFSSHLLPDVEAVCDQVIVMGAGKVLVQGSIQDLKLQHRGLLEVRVKDGQAAFVKSLEAVQCEVESKLENLLVRLPEGKDSSLLWDVAKSTGMQIRHLRPLRSTLEEVFLHALEVSN